MDAAANALAPFVGSWTPSCIAHLRWAGCFRRESQAEASLAYHQVFRQAALDRFQWSQQDLALQEAVCLFRICTNTVRHLQQDWPRRLDEGLSLVINTLP